MMVWKIIFRGVTETYVCYFSISSERVSSFSARYILPETNTTTPETLRSEDAVPLGKNLLVGQLLPSLVNFSK